MQSSFIFNQYYIDFLKKLKKETKQKGDDDKCKEMLKSIKDNYTIFDKSSEEYKDFLKQEISEDMWEGLSENFDDWIVKNRNTQIYKNITVENILYVFDDEYLCNHFISVFYIFSNDLSEEECSTIVKILQSVDGKELITSIENQKIRKLLENLHVIRNQKIKEKSGVDMNFIENTSIGKMAKEILNDINVEKLQNSINDNDGSVLKAIGDPNSGFSDVITHVSQKMAKKISDGDLNQENLFQDAMQFASTMPGLFGKNNGGRNNSKTPDMSGLMKMMSSMMGGMGGMDNMGGMFNEMARNQKAPKDCRRNINENALKKLAKSKQLKKKLRERERERTQNSNVETKDDE